MRGSVVASAPADRPVTNTVAPLRASSFAMPRPTPFVPPATIATLPFSMSVFVSMLSL